jgi:glycosyltransferase involved in cell wall biosynthesis
VNKKHKIAVFNGFYPEIIGGAEYQAKEIACLLQNANFEVFFLSIGHPNDEVVEVNGFKVYKFKNPAHFFNQATAYFFFSQRIFKILKEENPDLIYERMLNSFSPYLAYFANKNSIPFVLHIANKHSLVFDNSLRSSIRKILFNITKKYKPYFVAQNTEQAELLKLQGLETSLVLPNLVKLKFKVSDRIQTPLKIYWIGNNRPVKQLDKFIELAQNYSTNSNLIFFIIGKIDDLALEKKIAQTPNIDYLGIISNDEVNRHLETAFLLVNTSKNEGFSNTFVQAWMHGTPVVSLNSDPNNFIMKYKSGMVCNGEDGLLQVAVNHFLDDSIIYKQSVDACKELCEKELDYTINSKKIIDFISKLIYEK